MAVLTRRRLAGALSLCLCGSLAAAVMTGCFNPSKPACAFSCVEDGLCPTAYHCGDDGLCHRDDGQGGVCTLPPQGDAGPEAGADGEVDGGDGGGAP
jgi:hypothetical protein